MTRTRILTGIVLMLAALDSSGCGLLIGNVKPVDEKSDQYGVADLSKDQPQVWKRLTDAQQGADAQDPEVTATEVPDVAFQSIKTAAVISINSSCRASTAGDDAEYDASKDPGQKQDDELRALAHQLTFGISDVSRRSERKLTVQGSPALQTQLQGKLRGNPIAIRTIVFKRGDCVYDLLYMAPPKHFAENERDFDHFVASLRVK